ncbi:MAG: hypothetical protein L3K25_07865 [Gammaproteobacteria bacterium]|nr:hypothetical protein [Gammaproteobacteria bacterium]
MSNTTLEIETLQQHIQHTAGQLEKRSGLPSEAGMGSLIYLGNHHDAVPRDLILDPILESGEIHTWMLMKIHVDNPMLATRIPSQDNLIEQLKCSRPIVSRHMQVLRALRWLTLCAEVRGADGQFRGVVYAQHDQPLSLADTLYLDPAYIDFLEQPTKGDVLKRLRNIKHSVLTHTDYLVFKGQHLDLHPTHLEQLNARLKSHTSGDPLDTHLSCPALGVDPDGVKNLYGDPEKPAHIEYLKKTLEHPVKNIDTVNSAESHPIDHVKNIDTGKTQNFQENDPVKNFYMADLNKNDQNSDKSPCKKLLHGDSTGGVRGGSSLLNNKKQTTTTPPTPPSKNCPPLDFPKAVSKSPRQMAYVLKQLEPLPESERQYALHYLADRIKAGENGTDTPVGNAIRYLAWIVKNMLDGTLPDTDYGQRDRTPIIRLQHQAVTEDQTENQRRWEETMKRLGSTINSDGTATLDKEYVRQD